MVVICEICNKKFNPAGGYRTKCRDCVREYGREDCGLNDVLTSIKNSKQRNTLQKWANEKIANGGKQKGVVTRLYTLRKFAVEFNKPFENVTKDDVMKLLAKKEYNKVYYKKLLKQFFRAIYNDENPEVIRWLKVKKSVDEVKPEKKVLTDEDVLRILNATTTQRDRTILSIIAENPTRPKDICNLKVKDVKADEYGFELLLGSKTAKGRRTIRLINSVPELQMYLKNHPFKSNPEAPLFFQLSNNRYGLPVGWNALNNMLQNAVKRAKIKREVKLYDFRRTSTTRLLQDENYTATEVQVMGGWSSIRMLDVYGKVTSEMVNLKKLRVAGKIKDQKQQKEDLLKPVKCPRCETLNSIGSVACGKCWLPLKKEAIDLKEQVISKAIEWERPVNKAVIKEILREIRKEEAKH
jgi:integrase/recombinase XerD